MLERIFRRSLLSDLKNYRYAQQEPLAQPAQDRSRLSNFALKVMLAKLLYVLRLYWWEREMFSSLTASALA